jgi:hypothetical protein
MVSFCLWFVYVFAVYASLYGVAVTLPLAIFVQVPCLSSQPREKGMVKSAQITKKVMVKKEESRTTRGESVPRNKEPDDCAKALAKGLEQLVDKKGPNFCKYEDSSEKCAASKIIRGMDGGIEGEYVLLGILHDANSSLVFKPSTMETVLEKINKKFAKHPKFKNRDEKTVKNWHTTMFRRIRNMCYHTNKALTKKDKMPDWAESLPWVKKRSSSQSDDETDGEESDDPDDEDAAEARVAGGRSMIMFNFLKCFPLHSRSKLFL